MRSISRLEICTAVEATFSLSRAALVVPGMGRKSRLVRGSRRARVATGRAALLARDRVDLFDHREIPGEILAAEARRLAPPVVGSQVGGALEAARQESAAERAVGHEPDVELAQGRNDLVLRLAAPQRILGLQRADGMDLVRASSPYLLAYFRPGPLAFICARYESSVHLLQGDHFTGDHFLFYCSRQRLCLFVPVQMCPYL